MPKLPPETLRTIVDRLALAVFVFKQRRLVYANAAADALRQRIRTRHRIELDVMLRDYLLAFPETDAPAADRQARPIVTLITAPNGEPFYVHVTPLRGRMADFAVSVRAIGAEIDACRRRYRLSDREAQVAALVVHGYSNADIATALGIAPTTAKKHLTNIFDKVGVDSRSQLQARLA